MAYQGNPVVNTLPITSDSIQDGSIVEADLASAVVTKLNLASTKQDTLVSGTNIKTVGGQSLVGSGNIVLGENVSVISTNTNAVKSIDYVLTAALTLTLPASPVSGDFVRVINRSGTTTCVLGRNGSLIMGISEDFTIDILNFAVTFLYADTSRGWVMV